MIEHQEANKLMLGYFASLQEYKTNHILHFLLSVITGGIWILIWLCIASGNINNRNHIRVKMGIPIETNYPKYILEWMLVVILITLDIWILITSYFQRNIK